VAIGWSTATECQARFGQPRERVSSAPCAIGATRHQLIAELSPNGRTDLRDLLDRHVRSAVPSASSQRGWDGDAAREAGVFRSDRPVGQLARFENGFCQFLDEQRHPSVLVRILSSRSSVAPCHRSDARPWQRFATGELRQVREMTCRVATRRAELGSMRQHDQQRIDLTRSTSRSSTSRLVGSAQCRSSKQHHARLLRAAAFAFRSLQRKATLRQLVVVWGHGRRSGSRSSKGIDSIEAMKRTSAIGRP